MNPRPTFSLLAFGALLLPLLPVPAFAQRDADDPLPAHTVDFQPMDLAQMNLDGPPPLPNGPGPVTAPGGDTGGTRGLPTTPRDAGNGIGRVTVSPAATPAAAPANIRLNFQNASLTDVLNSLSASAGFIIVQEQPVSGTINLVSQQPVTADEAVDALNSVLADKGFASIRSGRVLKIIPREGAQQRNLPVVVGSDPAVIPSKDNLVTQILPVRYLDVGKLVDTLRPLLSSAATISSNDASNAILLTDTQVNIRRIAEIIHALDTNVSSISVIKVYLLKYADAKELADLITQLFSPTAGTNNNNNQQQRGFPGFGFFGRGGGGGGGGRGGGGGNNQQQQQPESAAREAAARVVAVADETTNSVVVSAPDEYMSAIADIVEKLDTNTTELTETQIFKLLHADATETAASLTALYSDSTTANGSNNNNNNRGQGGRGQPQQQQQPATGASERALTQARVITVADPRTNSILVNASRASMAQIALIIGRLDATDSKKQHVYVHVLSHADPTNVAYILNGMFSVTGTSSTFQQPSDARLQNRSLNGLTSDVQSSLGGSSSSNSGGTRPSGL